MVSQTALQGHESARLTHAAPHAQGTAVEAPNLSFGSTPVTAQDHTFSGTGLHSVLAHGALLIGLLVLAATTMGVGLLALIVAPIVEHFRWKKVRALVRGSGVHVAHNQLAFIDGCVKDFSRRLGMKEAPEVFVVEAATQNGVVMRLGTKNIMMLTDDVIWGALQSRDPRALGFVLGHELAHVALGHTGFIRSMLRAAYRPLSRCDEYTADNVAVALIGDRSTAVHGITLLTVGPQLLPYINDAALAQQAKEIWQDKHAKKAERGLTHPLLLRRIANALGMR